MLLNTLFYIINIILNFTSSEGYVIFKLNSCGISQTGKLCQQLFTEMANGEIALNGPNCLPPLEPFAPVLVAG